MERHFHHQKQKVKKVLGEVTAIDRKIKVLKRQNRKSVRRTAHAKGGRSKRPVSPSIESLMQRIEMLKKFIRGMFLPGR